MGGGGGAAGERGGGCRVEGSGARSPREAREAALKEAGDGLKDPSVQDEGGAKAGA